MDIDAQIRREMIDYISAAIADKQGAHQQAAAAIDAYLAFEPSGTDWVAKTPLGDPVERGRAMVAPLKAATKKHPPWMLAMNCREAAAVIDALLP